MDTKYTEFSASSKKIEITGDDRSVQIVQEDMQVNIVSGTVTAEPSADETSSAEAVLTEAALVETPSEEALAEALEPEASDEETSSDVAFTEAALVEEPAEEPLAEEAEEPAEEAPADDTPSEVGFTEAALVEKPFDETLSDHAEMKAFAGMEALKAGEVAAAAAQALAIAIEKRESRTEPVQYEDSFADLEAVERMALEMVKKEQSAKSSPAAETTAKAGSPSASEESTAIVDSPTTAAETTAKADSPSAATEITAGTATETAEPFVCPSGAPCGAFVTEDTETGAAVETALKCPSGAPCGALAAETGVATKTAAAAETGAAVETAAAATTAPDLEKATSPAAQPATAQQPQQTQKTQQTEQPQQAEQSQHPKPRNASGTVRVIGVRFRTAGKVYFFDPGPWEVHHGTNVIVETVRGIEYGTVVGIPMDISAAKVPQPLKEVIRVATPEDTETERRNRAKEKEAYRVCQEKIRAHGLEMKLINAEYTFDNSKVLFYFTADGRVDFRDLVKDLASVFRTRIELRQIGVRDETKILGGYGICGRPLCCHTWMSDFIPVSIKMAKEQNLSLNPGKISGVCGRLMCCLKNESDTYEELNRTLPRVGDEVQGKDGLSGQVESVNVLRQTVRILVEVDDEKEYHEYGVDDITVLRRRRRGGNRNRKDNTDPKEVQELERLESQERQPSRDRGNRKERGDRQDRNNGQDRGNNQDRNNGGNREDRGNNQDRGDRRNNRRRNGNGQPGDRRNDGGNE